MESYCPVCGEETPADTTSNATNTGRFVKNPEFQMVFECFIKLFEISDPPWFEKAFVFCSECSRQLTVVYELEKVMKEVERRLKESEKVVQDKLRSSEDKFQSSGVYGRDNRYWRVIKQFLCKDRNPNSETLSGVTSAAPSTLTPPESHLEVLYGPGPSNNGEDVVKDNQMRNCQKGRNGKRKRKLESEPGTVTQLETNVSLSFESEYNLDDFFQGDASSSSVNPAPLKEDEVNELNIIEEAISTEKEKQKPELTPAEEEEKALAISRWLTPGRPEVFHHGVRLFKIEDGKQYQCSACETILLVTKNHHKNLIKAHVIKHHTDLDKCECGERFPNNKSLQKHVNLVHNSIAVSQE